MRSRSLLFFYLIATLSIIGILVYGDNSYLAIIFANYELKVPTWIFIAVVAVIFPPFHWLYQRVSYLLSGSWLTVAKDVKLRQHYQLGMEAFCNGAWHLCIKHFKVINARSNNIATLILGARSAEKLSNNKLADEWIDRSVLLSSPDQVGALMSKINFLIGREDKQGALALIDNALPTQQQLTELIDLKLKLLKGLQLDDQLKVFAKAHSGQVKKLIGKEAYRQLL